MAVGYVCPLWGRLSWLEGSDRRTLLPCLNRCGPSLLPDWLLGVDCSSALLLVMLAWVDCM